MLYQTRNRTMLAGVWLLLVSTCAHVVARVEIDDPCSSTNQRLIITVNDNVPIGSSLAVFNSTTVPSLESVCSNFNITADLILLVDLRDPCTSSVECDLQCGDYSKQIIVRVNPVDEHAPMFPHATVTATFLENVPKDYIVFNFALPDHMPSDADCPNNKSWNYFIPENADGDGHFRINGGFSGKLVLDETVDYEKTKEYNVTVGVTNSVNGITSIMKGYTTVQVTIQDADDSDPTFANIEYNLNITEETINSAWLVTEPRVRGYDLDTGINATIQYAFANYENTSDFLTINATDGAFSVQEAVNRESTPMYTMTIWCYQSDNREKRAYATLFVHLLDINDNAAIFSPVTYDVTLVENAVGYVTTVSATDKDIGLNAVIIYEIINSTAALEINQHSGVISVKTQSDLDRELSPNITVLVVARDTDGNYSANTATVVVTLQDVNDNSPEFGDVPYVFHINSTSDGYTVGQIKAKDRDQPNSPNSNISYSLYPSPAMVPFKINIFNGTINIDGVFELQRDYNFLVKACDNPVDENERRCSIVDVDVLYGKNVTFSSHEMYVNVNENIAMHTLIAKRLPVTGDKYVCSTNEFDVDMQSHMMITKINLDRETTDIYHMFIEVFQYTLPKGNISVTVTVQDMNDNAPIFSQQQYFFTIPEQANSNLGSLNATDDDIGENANLSFTLQQGNTDIFTIDDVTGDVMISNQWTDTTAHMLSLYHIIAVASDRGIPSLKSVVPVYISSMIVCETSSVGIPTTLAKHAFMKDDEKQLLESNIADLLRFDSVTITGCNATTSHIFIKACMNNTAVPPIELQSYIVENWSPLQDIFRKYSNNAPTATPQHSDNGLSTSELALIAIAAAILIGGVTVILVVCKQWNMHVKSQLLYDNLRRPSTMYDSQELCMNFNEDESRFTTCRRSGRNETETSLEGSFGHGYVNTAFNSDGDDADTPKTPIWSCNDTPRIPRWSTSDSVKEAMASIDELTSRLNAEDNISRVSSMSRSRVSQRSSRDEPQTPRSDENQPSNSTDTGVRAIYENIVIDSPSQNPGVFNEEGDDGNDNTDDYYDRDMSGAEQIKQIIETNLNHDDAYESYEDTRPVIGGEIVTEEATAF